MEALEAPSVVMTTTHSNRALEVDSLRRELALRILLQNALLLGSVGLFVATSTAAALAPTAAWPIAVAQNAAILATSLQWCHHGVRTAQIKQYLLQLDQAEDGWERWLPANRPRTLLGSRWLVSTKGVFLGLGFGIVGLAFMLAPQFQLWAALTAAALWLTCAGFLFTNPKE